MWIGNWRHLEIKHYTGSLEDALATARRWWREACSDPERGEVVTEGLTVLRRIDVWHPGDPVPPSV